MELSTDVGGASLVAGLFKKNCLLQYLCFHMIFFKSYATH
jgi:hypothetical protein